MVLPTGFAFEAGLGFLRLQQGQTVGWLAFFVVLVAHVRLLDAPEKWKRWRFVVSGNISLSATCR